MYRLDKRTGADILDIPDSIEGRTWIFFHTFPGSHQDFCMSRLFGSSHFILFFWWGDSVGESSIRYINGPAFHKTNPW